MYGALFKNKIKLPSTQTADPFLVLAPVVKPQQTACFRYYGNATGVATQQVIYYLKFNCFMKRHHLLLSSSKNTCFNLMIHTKKIKHNKLIGKLVVFLER